MTSRKLLLLARPINHQDVVFDEQRKFGSFGCRQCRQVIWPRRGNFHLDHIEEVYRSGEEFFIGEFDVVFCVYVADKIVLKV